MAGCSRSGWLLRRRMVFLADGGAKMDSLEAAAAEAKDGK
jgi:hypothetical protein